MRFALELLRRSSSCFLSQTLTPQLPQYREQQVESGKGTACLFGLVYKSQYRTLTLRLKEPHENTKLVVCFLEITLNLVYIVLDFVNLFSLLLELRVDISTNLKLNSA